MKRADPRRKGMAAIDLMEEAVATLRSAPPGILFSYYLGALPFVLGLLYFWTDMSKSPFAQRHLGAAAFGVSLLYLWMKTWQAAFAGGLLAHLSGEPAPAFSVRRILRMSGHQAAWQPFSLFAIPVSFCLMLPFGWVFAYFHNLSVTGNGEALHLRDATSKAWKMASLWSGQNHIVIALFWLIWMIVFLNVTSVLLFLPELIRILTGLESVFTMSGFSMLNTTFFAITGGITFLCVNPVVKAVYVLRCFYGDSLHTGADLKAGLSTVARVAVLLISFTLMGSTGNGQPAREAAAEAPHSVSPQHLNETIERVISKREYQWRVPREKEDLAQDRSAIVEFVQGVRDWLVNVTRPLRELWDRFYKRLRGLFSREGAQGEVPPALSEDQLTLLLVLLAAASVILGLFLWRVWRRRKELSTVLAQAVTVVPDLKDENVVASQLPEDEWQALAAELMRKGELRLALRALYMASLAFLATHKLITIARYKSNLDYQRELLRRAREKDHLQQAFSQNVTLFERSWYGNHEVTSELMETFDINYDRIRTLAQE